VSADRLPPREAVRGIKLVKLPELPRGASWQSRVNLKEFIQELFSFLKLLLAASIVWFMTFSLWAKDTNMDSKGDGAK